MQMTIWASVIDDSTHGAGGVPLPHLDDRVRDRHSELEAAVRDPGPPGALAAEGEEAPVRNPPVGARAEVRRHLISKADACAHT